tara:strand:- start:535 stop:1152 length:618 start_codon:yes stop_codon:yes gene_type:complete
MIGIINYGLGNIKAIGNVFEKNGLEYEFIDNQSNLKRASKLILPGVGSFDYAMQCLNSSNLRETMEHLVFNKSIPILGICVGMQILTESSEEGVMKGLGWMDGSILSFTNFQNIISPLPLPHIGWNNVKQVKNNLLFYGLNNSQFYFLHSYFFKELSEEVVLSRTNYIFDYTSSFVKDNIFGVQFHPEKSHENGEQLLLNFTKNF